MQNELEHFMIGRSYGGNQDWMQDAWMKLGGCAALAAVDSCLYFTLFRKMKGLCPIDARKLTKDSYRSFGMTMKPYISPRWHGVDKMCYFTEGFGQYLKDRKVTGITMKEFPMGVPYAAAEEAIRRQIDAGIIIPMLHLTGKNRRVKEYNWHWFLLNGYRKTEEGFFVKAVTYSEYEWVDLTDLWHEDAPENGGLILYSLTGAEKEEDGKIG